eukprot:360553-Karenia_brevis.AAC.1
MDPLHQRRALRGSRRRKRPTTGEGPAVGAQEEYHSEHQEEESHEVQPVRVRKAPNLPTKEEVEEHEAQGHAAHRTWCAHCVKSRA